MTEALEPSGGPFLDRLGPRAARRAEPRSSIALAGAGCALAVLGVLIVAGDTGAGDDGFNQWPGVVLSATIVGAGFFALAQARTGAVATGGTVAAALGVPPLLFFLTWDDGGFPPYSTDAILVVSTAVWLGAYLIGPGRGRPFFLGAGLVALWATILELVEGLFDAPWSFIGSWMGTTGGVFDDSLDAPFGGSAFDPPDPSTLGLLSLLLGAAYLFAVHRLDRGGHHGTATPFAAATLPILFTVPLFLADDLEAAGTGLLTMVLGAALAIVGAAVLRRGLTWVGGAGVAIGAAVFLGDMTDDATVGGMLYLAGGIALVFAAHAWASARHEPDEMLVTAHVAATVLEPARPVLASDAPPTEDRPAPEPPPTPAPPMDAPPADASEPADTDDSPWAPPSDPDEPPAPTT